MSRIGIICCRKNWKKGCPGLNSHVLCFEALQHKLGPFKELEQAQLVSMIACDNCPGESLLKIAKNMVKEDKIDTIVFPYCVLHNKCPNLSATIREIQNSLDCQVLLGDFKMDPFLAYYLDPDYKHSLVLQKLYA